MPIPAQNASHLLRKVDALRRLLSNRRLPTIEIVSSAARLEPGTFGILKPGRLGIQQTDVAVIPVA